MRPPPPLAPKTSRLLSSHRAEGLILLFIDISSTAVDSLKAVDGHMSMEFFLQMVCKAAKHVISSKLNWSRGWVLLFWIMVFGLFID